MSVDVRGLYVCYFGVDEPLVHNQVIPYLRELIDGGMRMSLLTFEPDLQARWSAAALDVKRRELATDGIDWHCLPYHRTPILAATLWDMAAGVRAIAALHRREPLRILHGRSHVGAAIGVLARRLTGARVVFDIRGLLAEEYVEKGRWPPGGMLFRSVKAAERWLCKSADGFVVLTDRARNAMFPIRPARGQAVETIPCCIDLRAVVAGSEQDRLTARAELGALDRRIFVYVGTVGGAYPVESMAAFLAEARAANPKTYALLITQTDATSLARALEASGFSAGDYRVVRAAPHEVPRLIRAADVGLVLARSSVAARYASPTKFAEYLAAGLPVVATAGVGDLDAHLLESRTGVLLSGVDPASCRAALAELDVLLADTDVGARSKALACSRYDLRTVGGPRYRRLYQAVLAPQPDKRTRALAFASYPFDAASSRYRVGQFLGPLARRGVDVRIAPFLDATLFGALYEPKRLMLRLPRLAVRVFRQLAMALGAVRADVILVQREAMLVGPPIVEWAAVRLFRRPLVLDLDDATYVPQESPVYGRLASFAKWPGKTDQLIRWAHVVVCGNPNIAAHAQSCGAKTVIVPTVVDSDRFRPRPTNNHIPVIGWVGTHSTFPFLERLLPLFEDLARTVSFRLMIVGSGRSEIHVDGVDVEMKPWDLEREVTDFQSLDVGVYPMPDTKWSAGKSGLKAVQYMMSGVPAVISPVGVCATIGAVGQTHLTAVTDDEWLRALRLLLTDRVLRRRMGESARTFAEQHYATEGQADLVASVLRSAVS